MKGIYLGAYIAYHPNYDIVYQDINGKRDLPGDMMTIDLSDYDFIIATPPCNYWSRANWRRDISEYALATKHLLPDILFKLANQDKPFIVENVRNDRRFNEIGLFSLSWLGVRVYKIGRHTYWTNIELSHFQVTLLQNNQVAKTDYKNGKKRYLSSQNLPRSKRQGTEEVHDVIEVFLAYVALHR